MKTLLSVVLLVSLLWAAMPVTIKYDIYPAQVTTDGFLKQLDMTNGMQIALGNVPGYSYVEKFGNAPDFDATDGFVTVWDGADDGHVDLMDYVYSTAAATMAISSTGADTIAIEVQGLGADSTMQIDTVTTSGQAKVTLDSTFIRVFRMKNINTVDNVGHIYLFEDTTVAAGIPVDSSKVRAILQPGNNQTLMAIYTIPMDKKGYFEQYEVSIAGANKTSNYTFELRTRELGGVFQIKDVKAVADNGTSNYTKEYKAPLELEGFTDIEVRVKVNAAGATAASFSAGFHIKLVTQ